MVVTGSGPCALALRWPSPRLKLGGASAVASRAGSIGSESYELSCYLTARPGYRTAQRLGSPPPGRPQRSARALCESARAPAVASGPPREQRNHPTAQPEWRGKEAHHSEDVGLRLPSLDDTQCSDTVSPECGRPFANSAPLSSQAMAFHEGAEPCATAPAAGSRPPSLHEPDAAAGSMPLRRRHSPDGATSPGPETSRRQRGPSPEGELEEILKSRARTRNDDSAFQANLNIPGNIENICRSSFQAASLKRDELESALAWRRREQYAQVRHQTRSKAQAWMRRCEKRRQQELIRLQQEKEAEEAERLRVQELSERANKKERRELKFAHMKERLEGDGASRRKRRTRDSSNVGSLLGNMSAEEAEQLLMLQKKSINGQSVYQMGNARKPDALAGNSPKIASQAKPSGNRDQEAELKKIRVEPGRSNSKNSLESKSPKKVISLQERMSMGILNKINLSPDIDESMQDGDPGQKLERFRLPPTVATIDQRIDNMRRAHKLKARADRRAQEEAARKSKFEMLSGSQQTAVQWAFELYDRISDAHNHLGLDAEGLRNAVVELGLRGCCTAEWKAIKQMCEASAPKKEGKPRVGCDMFKLAVDVVPEIRRALTEYRRNEWQRLSANCKRNWEDGHIDVEDAFQCIQQCWPLVVELEGGQLDQELHEGVRRCLRSSNEENSDMANFAQEVEQLTEEHQHKCSAFQRHLQKMYHLDEELFTEYRTELISVHSLFLNMDRNEEECVTSRDLIYIFKELHLLDVHVQVNDSGVDLKLGADTWQARAVSLIKDAEPISFRRFLELTREISDLQEAFQPKAKSRAETLQEAFDRHCLDDEFEPEPFIVPDQLPAIFKEVQIEAELENPCSQAALSRLLADADLEGSGHLTLDMVRKHCRVAALQLRVQDVLEEMQLGKKYNFGFVEVRDMRGVFHQFDEDDSGMLEQGEVEQALKLLNLDCPSTRENYFSVAFSMLDEDGSGALDFFEFMHLIQRVRDKEGIFKSEDSPITTLKDLDRMDMLLVLDCFDIDAREWEDNACKQRMYQLLEVDDRASLMSVLHVQTLAELFSHCRWRHEYLQNTGQI